MFIIILTYVKPIEDIDRLLPAHNAYLEQYYHVGKFIVSGRRIPRVGGVILANASSTDEVQTIIRMDPFYVHEVARYDITEFLPTKYLRGFAEFALDQEHIKQKG